MQIITTLLISILLSLGFGFADNDNTTGTCDVQVAISDVQSFSDIDIGEMRNTTSSSTSSLLTFQMLFAYVNNGVSRRWRRVWNARKGKWSWYMLANYCRQMMDFLSWVKVEWLRKLDLASLVRKLELRQLDLAFNAYRYAGYVPNLWDLVCNRLDEMGRRYVWLKHRPSLQLAGVALLLLVVLITPMIGKTVVTAATTVTGFGGALGSTSISKKEKHMKTKQSLRDRGYFNAYGRPEDPVFLEPEMSVEVEAGKWVKMDIEKGTYCSPILESTFDSHECYIYNAVGQTDEVFVRAQGERKDEAVLVKGPDGKPLFPKNLMRTIRQGDEHSIAIHKDEVLKVYKFTKDGKVVDVSSTEDYEATMALLGIKVNMPDDTAPAKAWKYFKSLAGPAKSNSKRTKGLCWTSINKLWEEGIGSHTLGSIINLEWIQMWTFGKLLKAFRVNQSDAIAAAVQAAKVCKYISRLFRNYRFWTFETLTECNIPMHSSLEYESMGADGAIGEISLECARHKCGLGHKVKVGDYVQITYLTPKGLLKGIMIVVPNKKWDVDMALIGDQWKDELSYIDGKSFLGIDRIKGNDLVFLESQTLGNIKPFRPLAVEWAHDFIDDIANRVVTGDVRGPMGKLGLVKSEDDLRKSNWTIHKLMSHDIDALTPFAVNRFWTHFKDMIRKGENLRVQIPGSTRRVGFADLTSLDKEVGDVKPGWVHTVGDAVIFSRADGFETMLSLGDGDVDGDYYIIHHLEGAAIYVPVLDAKGKPILDKEGKAMKTFSHWEGDVLLHRQPNQHGEWFIKKARLDYEPTCCLNGPDENGVVKTRVNMTNEFHKPAPFEARDDVASIPGKLFEHVLEQINLGNVDGIEKALKDRVPRKYRNALKYIDGPYTKLFNEVQEMVEENSDRIEDYVDNMELPDWIHSEGHNDMYDVAKELWGGFAVKWGEALGNSDAMAKNGESEITIDEYLQKSRKSINSQIRSLFNAFTRSERRLIVKALMYIVYVELPGTENSVGRMRTRMNDGILNVPGPKCGHKGTCVCYAPGHRYGDVEGIVDVVIEVLVDHGHGNALESIDESTLKLANLLFGKEEGIDYHIVDSVSTGYINSDKVDITKVSYMEEVNEESRLTAYIYGGWKLIAMSMYDEDPESLSEGRQRKAMKAFRDLIPGLKGKGLSVAVKHGKIYCNGDLFAFVAKKYHIVDGNYLINSVPTRGDQVLVTFSKGGDSGPLPASCPDFRKVIGIPFGDVKDVKQLTTATKLVMVAEPDNKDDKEAIAVYVNGHKRAKLGYIPRNATAAFRKEYGNKEEWTNTFRVTGISSSCVFFEESN